MMWYATQWAAHYLRQRMTIAFGLIVFFCGGVCALIWYFDTIDDLAFRILATSLIGLGLATLVSAPPVTWRSRGETGWFAAYVLGSLILLIATKFDISAVTVNAAIFLVVIALWWVAWQFMGRQWLLLTGFMFAVGIAMCYWIGALATHDGQSELLLLPVPTFILVGIAWSPCAHWVFSRAAHWKGDRVRGPGMQALAMLWLFLPAIVVTVGAPIVLELGEIWTAVSATVSGFLLSTMVSNPLRQFLLEWGNLD